MVICMQLWYFHLGWYLLALRAVKARAGPNPRPSSLIYPGPWPFDIMVVFKYSLAMALLLPVIIMWATFASKEK
jgi:hypothetical protein